MATQNLSKSRFLAGQQCDLRLWRQINDPLSGKSAGNTAILEAGRNVGVAAHGLFEGGVLVTPELTHAQAVERTEFLMADKDVPAIFEAAFTANGVRIRVDLLVRMSRNRWGLLEVKSSTVPKDGDKDKAARYDFDIAVQFHVLRRTGVRVGAAELVIIDPRYRKGAQGLDPGRLFKRVDRRRQVVRLQPEVEREIGRQKRLARREKRPEVDPDHHCHNPVSCEFWDACAHRKPPDWVFKIPRLKRGAYEELSDRGIVSVQELTNADLDQLSRSQSRVVRAHRTGEPFLSNKLREALAPFGPPALYLDFETMAPALPIYRGTRPYQVIPFQWSLHGMERRDGRVVHKEFLAENDGDPRPMFAETLLEALAGSSDPIIVYSSYEKRILKALATTFPKHRRAIRDIIGRLQDLLVICRRHTYYPGYQFSYSIKSVAPALVPGFGYDDLSQIAGGSEAAAAFVKLANREAGSAASPSKIRTALLAYCKRDTEALVELHRALLRL